MNRLDNNGGFTLVESLVASILALIIGFVIYTVAFFYTNESSSSISRFMMQQQFDNVALQVASDVHRASFVVAEGETPVAHGVGFDSVASIQLFDQAGRMFGQYSIVNGVLYEGIQQKQYCAGGIAIHVVDANSFFIIHPQRKTLTLQLSICKTERNNLHTLSLRRVVFLCRN
jgi:hypothetical protein